MAAAAASHATVAPDEHEALHEALHEASREASREALEDLHGPDAGRRLAAIVRLGAWARPHGLIELARFSETAPDETTRLVAARALVRAGDAPTLARFAAQASDPKPPRRFEALTMLREADALSPAGRQAAERALADVDPAIRLVGLELLASHPSSDAVPAIAAVIADGSRDVRLAAIRALGLLPDGRALLPLLDRLETGDRAERIAVLDALAAFRGSHPRLQAGPAVLRYVHDANEEVRMAAIEAVGRLRWAAAVPVLRTIAMSRPRERPARRAAVALGTLAAGGDEPALAALVELLREPAPIDEVMVSLTRVGAAAIGPLGRVMRDGFTTSAVAAARILADMGDRAATPVLADVLKTSPSAAVALGAARALERLRDPAALPALMAIVSSTRWTTTGNATGVAPGVTVETTGPGTREAALDALAALGDTRAAAVVEAAAKDPEVRVRRAGLKLAAAIQLGLSRDTLAARLQDPDPLVRALAIETAARLIRLDPLPLLIEAVSRSRPGDAAWLAGISLALERVATQADRPTLLKAIMLAPPAHRPLFFRALAAVGSASTPLPAPVATLAIDVLSAGGAKARDAADALSAFQLDGSAVRALSARLPVMSSSNRARLGPALAQARSRHADVLLAAMIDADPDPGVRAASAWAARSRRHVPQIGEALTRARRSARVQIAENAAAARADHLPVPDSPAATPDLAGTAGWIRLRLLAADHTPVVGHWIRVRVGATAIWAFSDESGEAVLRELPRGPYFVFAASMADQTALTEAIASGKSPAITPVGP